MKQPIVRTLLEVTVLDITPAVWVLVLVECLCVLVRKNVDRCLFLVPRTRDRPLFLVPRTLVRWTFLVLRTQVCPACLVPTRVPTEETSLVGGCML